MANRAVKLSEKNVKKIDALVKTGQFKSPNAAVAAGLKLLTARDQVSPPTRRGSLEDALRDGEESIAKGDTVLLKTPRDVRLFFQETTTRAIKKAKR